MRVVILTALVTLLAMPALAEPVAQVQGANPLAGVIAQQRELFANALASAQVQLQQKDAEIAHLKKLCGKGCEPAKPDQPEQP